MFRFLIQPKLFGPQLIRNSLRLRVRSSSLLLKPQLFSKKLAAPRNRTLSLFSAVFLGFAASSHIQNLETVKSDVGLEDNAKEIAESTTSKLVDYVSENGTTASKNKQERHAIYRKITTGSLLGLVSGIIVGKVSQILVIVSSTIFIFLEILRSRGLLRKPRTDLSSSGYSGVKKTGSKIANKLANSVDYINENPALRLSFLISFLMSATA